MFKNRPYKLELNAEIFTGELTGCLKFALKLRAEERREVLEET